MGEIKQINIKNPIYFNLKDSDARLLKIDKKEYNKIDIYYIS